MNKIIIIMKEDIDKYPPILSLLNIAIDENWKVVLVAGCQSNEKYCDIVKQGVKFYRQKSYKGNLIKRLFLLIKIRRNAFSVINKEYDKDSLVWIIQSEMVALLGKRLKNYRTIGHFLELRNPQLSIGYRLLTIGNNYKESVRNLNKVVCCEYNRAQITKWLFMLKDNPVILPNKPYLNDEDVVADSYISNIIKTYEGKKIILYQGFIDKERNLEAFIEAIISMPKEYILFIMGSNSSYKKELMKKYNTEKVVYIDFITPPAHLCITRMCSIGILSYMPSNDEIGSVLNVLYCAPNKLYEYSRYGKPMVSNNNPALYMAFSNFKAGKCVDSSNSIEIKDAIIDIINNYQYYSAESQKLYNSVDIRSIVMKIISDTLK